jgi:hypothetical protein
VFRLCRMKPGVGARKADTGKHGQNFPDGGLPAGGFWQRKVRPDLVAVTAAILLLDDVAGVGQVGDDAVGAAFGDADAGRDVTQPHSRVVGNAQQHPSMVGQETPVRHAVQNTMLFSGNTLLVLYY